MPAYPIIRSQLVATTDVEHDHSQDIHYSQVAIQKDGGEWPKTRHDVENELLIAYLQCFHSHSF